MQVHQNCLFITHFRHLAICLTYMATREMGNKKTILREKKNKTSSFPNTKKTKTKTPEQIHVSVFSNRGIKESRRRD